MNKQQPVTLPKNTIFGRSSANRRIFKGVTKRDRSELKIIVLTAQKRQKYKAKKQEKGEPMLKTNTFYKAKKIPLEIT